MRYLKQLNKHKNNKTKSEMKHKTLTFRFLDMSRSGFARLFLLLLLPCLSAIGVKAADSNGGVKFNSGVRYSQWAINSRATSFYANTTECGMAKITNEKVEKASFGKKSLDYVPGLVAKSMIEAADYYQGFDWSKPWFLSVKEYGDKYYGSVEDAGGSLDNLNAVKLYIGLYNNTNATGTDQRNYKTAISRAQEGLKAHDTNNSIKSGTLAGDAVVGGWFHKADYNNQMWLDGAYMGSALLAQIVNFNKTEKTGSSVFGSTTADWAMVFKQLDIVWNMCWNSTDKLMYHAFEANAGTGTSKSHADTWAGLNGTTEPYTFHSAAYWGRANAWYLMALVDVLEAMKNAGQESTNNYTTLKQHLAELAAGIAARQDSKTGGWYQVLNKDASFTASSYNSNWSGKPASVTNYIETSATAIFAAAYFKAVRCGVLESTTQYDYKTIAKNAFEGLVNNYTYLDNNGDMQIWGSCRSAGLGGGTGTEYAAGGKKYRDGSNEYYLLGYDVPMVKQTDDITEGKVLGGFIMAATEYERAYQNQDSKQILFAKDLAPNYTTAATLDATAYGDGTVSYQWYKDGKAITDAASATYTPTENGNYYCEATANGKTIKTSITKVTVKSNSNTDNGSTDNNGGSENGTTSTVLFSYDVPTTGNTSTSDVETNGGKIAYQKIGAFSNDGYKIDNTTKYIKVTLTGNKLQQGDVISISINTKGAKDIVAKDENGKSITLNNISSDNSTISYNVTESDILNRKEIFYLYRNTSSVYVKAIKITRANTQVALTASFSPATISATEGDAAQNLPTLTVKAGETTLTANDYTVTYASDNDAVAKVENDKVSFVGKGETNIVATIKPTNTNKYKETSATFAVKVENKQTPVDPTESGVIYDFTTSVGTTSYGISCTSTNGIIKFSSNFSANDGKYITIKPSTGGFKAGDVITLNGYCDSKNLSGVIIYSDVKGNSIFKSNILATSTAGGSEFTYTLTEDCDALYLGRYGGGTTCLKSLQVNRPASSSGKTRLTASFERNADVIVNTTTTATLPTLTVKAGEKTLTAGTDYTVDYKSNAEGVATLSDNTITIKNLGIATITATVTPTDANTYEGTTATYQLSVKAPSPLNVSVMDVTINTTDTEEEQPVIKVYGDNDKLLKLGQDYTLSFAVSGDNVTVDETTGKFSVTKNADKTAFIKGTSLITVTATPTPTLGSNYTIGTLQFSYSVSEGKIKPVFLDSFKDITINLHQDDTSREIIVPLIYNGEDVSSYFKYTYKVTAKVNGQIQEFTENTLNYTPSTAGTYTVTVSATPGQNGEDNYGDVYDSPDPISFNLDINSTHQVIAVTPDPASIKMYAGTTQVAPDLTVKKGNATLAYTEYDTSWFSTSPGVVKVDATTGKIEAVSEGTANIRVVVTGKNLESTTALITIDVDDPAVYRVHANEEYKSQKTMWNQDENLSVTLGGWLFPGTVDNLWTTGEQLTSTVDWNFDKSQNNYNARKAPWKITGFDYVVKAGDNQKNARQEMGSNSMPETTLISNVDYTKKDYIVDPMFNVPCSGSFLTFQPKTNGTVVAHIYQNGVFDSKKNKGSIEYQYRPQRRVFIMDEAGNFVSSDAHIESTTGKPNGKNYTLSDYKWDMGDKQSPTVETVKLHFGLKSFEMSETGFKNNVYENQLDQTIAPNEAAKKHPDLKGSRGWSVLADAPVTYTFKVKAGKTYYLYNFGSKIGFYGFSFDEGETKPKVDPVNYNADDANANNVVEKTAEGHVAQVKIARKMVANRWTTCVLPFSLNKHQVDAIFGATYSIDNKEGTQILYFDHVEGSKAYFVRHAYNTIVAGKPFLIKPTKNVESINTADVTDYPYVTIENTTPDAWCESNDYVWTSSYNTMNIAKNDYFIGASDGKFKAYSAASGTVKGFRGFLKAKLPASAKPTMLSISTSSITDGNDGETTGIEDLIITADGELMPANSRVYNINGQLVNEDASNFLSLPSGIYIINGKKYIK